MDVEGVVVDALAHLGIGSRPGAGGPDRGVDVLIDPEGVATPVQLKRRSLVTDDVASRLLDEAAPGAVPWICHQAQGSPDLRQQVRGSSVGIGAVADVHGGQGLASIHGLAG